MTRKRLLAISFVFAIIMFGHDIFLEKFENAINYYDNDSNYIYESAYIQRSETTNQDVEEINNIDIKLAEARYNTLPDNVINYLKTKDVSIYITNDLEELKDVNPVPNGYTTGATYNKNNTSEIVFYSKTSDNVLLHEIGHAIDYQAGNGIYISSSKEFGNLYKSESTNIEYTNDSVATEHIRSNEKEYFAEAFQRYITNPEKLMEQCPNTYLYMKNFIEAL